jgi:type IV pilus assembly protein PilM
LLIRRWLNQRTPNNLVGLDIQPDSIKLLEINTLESPHKIENFAITPLPSGAIVKDEIKDATAISNALHDLFKQYNIKAKYVAIAIPRSAAIIKNITIDSRLTASEIESRAWIEANRYFPDLVGDIHLDFNITGPSAQDSTQLDMVLVACRKEQIKPYLEIIHQSGLITKIVDVNCYALERAMSLIPNTNTEDNLALLNLNFTLSSLIVVQQNQLVYAHDHSYDGLRLTNQIKKINTEATAPTADAEATVATTNPETPVTDVAIQTRYTDVFKENLTSHLRHTMHFFYSSRPNVNIQKLVIAGDCAAIPGLVEFIHQETNIDTELADPFVNMNLAQQINTADLHRSAPGLMLSCGLALSKIR